MNKVIAGFCVAFVLLSILSGVMDGNAGALAATDLTADIDDAVVVLPVTSTTGFMAAGGVVMIGNEKISFTGVTPVTFTGCTRGIEGTEPSVHYTGDAVYNEDLGIVNAALGFSVVRASIPGGWAGVINMSFDFITITLPRIILWDYAFLQGDLLIVRYCLMAMSLGLVMYLASIAINTIAGVLSKIW